MQDKGSFERITQFNSTNFKQTQIHVVKCLHSHRSTWPNPIASFQISHFHPNRSHTNVQESSKHSAVQKIPYWQKSSSASKRQMSLLPAVPIFNVFKQPAHNPAEQQNRMQVQSLNFRLANKYSRTSCVRTWLEKPFLQNIFYFLKIFGKKNRHKKLWQ